MHYPRNTVGKKKRKYRSLTCHTVPGLSFLSQKATCFVFLNRFFSYNKNKQTSQAAASRRIKQREEATRHHHVSRTCTWPCSVLLHHSLTQTHRQTHTQHTHTQTDSHATFEKKKISCFRHFPESLFSGCTKANEAFMAIYFLSFCIIIIFIFINIMLL